MTALTTRGYRGPGRGRASYVEAPREWRATTAQACGLFPWHAGSGSPTVGVPLGRHLLSGDAVMFDVLTWFARARLISNPSAMILGLPGLGKSTVARRQIIGTAAMGGIPLVLGDLKGEHVGVVEALGGQVIRLGRGLGSLNPLDPGAMDDAARLVGGKAGQRLREEAHGRRLALVRALVTVARGGRTLDVEDAAVSAALRLLAQRHGRRKSPPVLSDLLALLEEGPEQVRAVTLDRGSDERYRAAVDPLMRSLLAIVDGPLGSVFGKPTTERLRLDAPAVCVDVSSVSTSDASLSAAVLLATWSEGFGAVEASNALADAGVAPQRRFLAVLDELWRVLRVGNGLVSRVDEITRLNRSQGVGQLLLTHSLADLRSMPDPADIAQAQGFLERAGAVLCAGLPARELDEVASVVPFTHAERDLVTSWATPPGWSEAAAPPGRGRVLVKVGQRPGIPVEVVLTPSERALPDTNARWLA